jgi:hypothetical protein
MGPNMIYINMYSVIRYFFIIHKILTQTQTFNSWKYHTNFVWILKKKGKNFKRACVSNLIYKGIQKKN